MNLRLCALMKEGRPFDSPGLLPCLFFLVCFFSVHLYTNAQRPSNTLPVFESMEVQKDKTVTFRFLAPTEDLKVLNERKIKNEFFNSGDGHTWMNCKLILSIVTPKIFK